MEFQQEILNLFLIIPLLRKLTRLIHFLMYFLLPWEASVRQINHTHEILKLYKSGKSNVEIAKLLSLGTGEVKLIIDLYKEGK